MLWDAGRQSDVEAWLKENIKDAIDRKIILIDWCKYFAIAFTKEKAVAIGAEQLPPP